MGSLVRAMAALVRERRIDFDVASIRKDLQHSGLTTVATDLLIAAQRRQPVQAVIVVDQFEELLTQTGPDERAAIRRDDRAGAGRPVQALATMRPEFLDPASKDAALSKIAAAGYITFGRCGPRRCGLSSNSPPRSPD